MVIRHQILVKKVKKLDNQQQNRSKIGQKLVIHHQ